MILYFLPVSLFYICSFANSVAVKVSQDFMTTPVIVFLTSFYYWSTYFSNNLCGFSLSSTSNLHWKFCIANNTRNKRSVNVQKWCQPYKDRYAQCFHSLVLRIKYKDGSGNYYIGNTAFWKSLIKVESTIGQTLFGYWISVSHRKAPYSQTDKFLDLLFLSSAKRLS